MAAHVAGVCAVQAHTQSLLEHPRLGLNPHLHQWKEAARAWGQDLVIAKQPVRMPQKWKLLEE